MSSEFADFNVYSYDGTGSFSVDKDGLHITDTKYLKSSNYIYVRSDFYTFTYDVVVSISAGNQFYLGWERYDKDKTARSNNACVYVVTTTPSTDIVKARYRGTVDLSTDGVNPLRYIKLRVLNLWTSSSAQEGTATVHSLSLLGIPTNENIITKAYRNGEFVGDHFREFSNETISIQRVGYINSSNLYEY